MLTALLSYLYVYDMKGAKHDCSLLLADDIEMIRNGYMQREKLRPRVNRAEMERLIIYIVPLPMWEGW